MRSFAQWSRASEVVFSKRRGDVKGRVRKMCFVLISVMGEVRELWSEVGLLLDSVGWYSLIVC